MRVSRTSLPLLAALLVSPLDPSVARGQTYVNPYVGVYAFDDGGFEGLEELAIEVDPAPLFGVRVGHHLTPRWAIEGVYGFAPLTLVLSESEVEELDANENLYYGAVTYLIPTARGSSFLISGGLGGFTFSPEDEESITDFLLSVGI